MSLPELIPSIDTLPRIDKLLLMQHLASTLAAEEPQSSPPSIEIWSPFDAHQGAAVLLDYLEKTSATKR